MIAKEFLRAVANGEVDLIQLLLDILAATNSEYCVIGGLAVNAYAEPAVSLDLDVAVVSRNLGALCQEARSRGLEVEEFPHSVNLTSPKSDLRIQLQTDDRYQPFIPRAETKQVLGYAMRVARIEDVLQDKIWAYQDQTRRASKRQLDAPFIHR